MGAAVGEDGRAARAPPAPLTEHQRRHHGLALVRWWYRQAALVYRHPAARGGWARAACALAPLVCLLPGVLRLQEMLAGAWNGWRHCGHRPEDRAVWITAVDSPTGPEFGTKGATVGQALRWRYPQVLYARAPRPDPCGSRLPYTWRQYLAPMWREETGEPLRRQTGPRRVVRWDDPPPPPAGSSARSAALPSSRGRRPPAGTTPWGWTGGAGSGTMTPPASRPPTPGRHGGTWPTPSTTSSPRLATCGGPSCRSPGRSTPRRCGPTPSAALGRGRPGTACTRPSGRPSASRATGSVAALRGRRRLPSRSPAAARHSPRRRPLRRPARPPLAGDRGRQPDPGAAGPWPTAILQACLAAPLTCLPAPCGQRWADLCGGWGLTPPPPRARAPGQGYPLPPPGAGPTPPSCCYDAGTWSPTRAPCASRWQTSPPCACIGTRSLTGGRTWC